MAYLSNKQLALLRLQLQDVREDMKSRLEQNQHFGKANSMRDETGELSPIDNHPGDLASELYEREKDISLLEQEKLQLMRINAALAAMDNGAYGLCSVCGVKIPYERLEAVPDTLFCIDHAPRHEVSERRPVEEPFLQPPFGRTSLDEQKGYNGFDGEDAWQIVESWGNSDSPAMSENPDASDYAHIGLESTENDGYVESLESFLATDITGRYVTVIRNREYDQYMHSEEGDHGLESDDEYNGIS